ncbi:MAG: hypothetical protein ACNA8W_16385, partial [Bradymonadaceae bacterium]
EVAGAQLAATAITGYELKIGAEDWRLVGDTTTYTHSQAPGAEITLSASPTASQGTFVEFIRVSYDVAGGLAIGEPPSTDYRVRALTSAGAGAESDPETGKRTVGAPTYQWLRSNAADGTYEFVPGAIDPTHDDRSGPANATTQYYRFQVSAPGANTETSASVAGSRAVAAVLITEEMDPDSLNILRAYIESLGDPPIEFVGFCWGTMDAPSLDNGAHCELSGTPPMENELVEHIVEAFSFEPTTTYHVRSYGSALSGVVYGSQISFMTP